MTEKTDPPEQTEEEIAFELAKLLEAQGIMSQNLETKIIEINSLRIELGYVDSLVMYKTEQLTLLSAKKARRPQKPP